MDQKELKKLENQCTQTEPPFCMAACPLHVDIKAFILSIQQKNWSAARESLEAKMPFPEILGRICDHPCETMCRRSEAGDPISIGALERVVILSTNMNSNIQAQPRRSGRVAVISGGLSSMTVARDLSLKGYGVTLFTSQNMVGGRLAEMDEDLLPTHFVVEAHDQLISLGAAVALSIQYNNEFLNMLNADFEAIYIGFDDKKENTTIQNWFPHIERIDPITFYTGSYTGADTKSDAKFDIGSGKIFAGGLSEKENDRSWVMDAAQGRWAAISIDRFLQNVSLTASREKQGPSSSRLFTETRSLKPLPVISMAQPDKGYSCEEAVQEAKRCIQCECMVCVKACSFLTHYGGYPKTYVREIYNNNSIVLGIRKANTFINSCSLCGLCEESCPESLSMAEVCREARAVMIENRTMPASIHEFALNDMAFANGEKAGLFRSEPQTTESRYLFYPGCQLAASSPELVKVTYEYLRAKLKGGVAIGLGCCGAPADWAVKYDLVNDIKANFLEQFGKLGSPILITACPTCFQIFNRYLPELEITTLWEILDTIDLPTPDHCLRIDSPLALHDPCTARYADNILESVRSLLSKLGISIQEFPFSRRRTKCCGFGGLMENANPILAKEVVKARAKETTHDIVTYCAMCRDNLSKAGKRTIYLPDLIFNSTGNLSPDNKNDPAEKKPPNLSQRRENRIKLKNEFLQSIWRELLPEAEEYSKLFLLIPANVGKKMEDVRILEEDIKQVIYHAEKTGKRFRHFHTGRFLGSYQPEHVTFWVEYAAENNHFSIYNVYCHRMMILQEGIKTKSSPKQLLSDGWQCDKCGKNILLAGVSLEYLDNRFTPDLPVCKTCGQVYVSEELATGKMAEVEKMLEDK